MQGMECGPREQTPQPAAAADGAGPASLAAAGLSSPLLLPQQGPDSGSPRWLDLSLPGSPRFASPLAAAADLAAEEALAAATANVAQMAARPGPADDQQQQQEAGQMAAGHAEAAGAAPPSAAAMAAAPSAPTPLHFVCYRVEQYTRSLEPPAAPVRLTRWLLQDSHERWHLAVDTAAWEGQATVYEAVPPFSVVRPLSCHTVAEVQAYLEQFIPAEHRQQQQQQEANGADASDGGLQQQQVSDSGPMAAYAASLQPAGVKRRPGRPRIHPPKEPKKPRQAKAAAGAAGAAAANGALPTQPAAIPGGAWALLTSQTSTAAAPIGAWDLLAAQAASGAAAAAAGAAPAAPADAAGKKPGKPRTTLAEAVFIESEERRQEVYELRLEAALSELALLKAQCGVDYSLTLISPSREVEVVTSATANVQAVKVVRSKRPVGKPADELEPAAADTSAAAAAAAAAAVKQQQEQKQTAAGGLLPMPLLPLPPMPLPAGGAAGVPGVQQQQHASATPAASKQQQQKKQAGRGSTGTGKGKRRGRPPAHLKEEEEEEEEGDDDTPPAKRARAGRLGGSSRVDPEIRQLIHAMREENGEPYMQGTWRRQPYEPAELEYIEEYVLAEDCGEERDAATLPAKLASSLAPPAGAEGAAAEGGAAAAVDGSAAAAAADGAAAGASGRPADDLMVVAQLPQGLAQGEVEVRQVWGIDRYTRRYIWEALGSCSELGSPNTVQLDEARQEFIEGQLLPALNRQDEDGWDVSVALQQLASTASGPQAEATKGAASLLLRVVEAVEAFHSREPGQPRDPEEREYFRVHPKGEGVVLLRAGGLPAGAFLGEYLGELYAAWRWLERDSNAGGRRPGAGFGRRSASLRLGTSDEFYNCSLERPAADPKGYDVLFVNAAHKGNFTSRLCHSCSPNCKIVPMVAGGRLTIGVWTTRPVAAGEELTLDWACETENEREHKLSVCLCGSSSCRGSLLYLVKNDPSGPLHQYAHSHHTFLDRCQLLLSAAGQAQPSEAEEARLARHGFGESLLHDGVAEHGGAPIPAWLRRWASLVLDFIEREAEQLPKLLTREGGSEGEEEEGKEEGEGEGAAVPEEVAAEVDSQRRSRLQALAFALDRAKMVLRHQEEEARSAPLCELSEEEAVEFLWTGDESVARRAVAALASFTERAVTENLVQGRQPRNAAKPAWLENSVDVETGRPLKREAAQRPQRRASTAGRKHYAATMLGALSSAPSGSTQQPSEEPAAGGRPARRAAAGKAGAGDRGVSAEPVDSPLPAAGAKQKAAAAEAMEVDGAQEGSPAGGGAAQQQNGQAGSMESGEEQHQQRKGGVAPPAAAAAAADLSPADEGTAGPAEQQAGSKRAAGQRQAKGGKRGQQEDEEEQEEEEEEEGDEKEGEGEFETLADQLESLVDDTEVTTLAEAQAALRRLAGLLRAAGVGHAGLHDILLLYASVQRWVGTVDLTTFSPELVNGEAGERYRPQYLWALLSSWWRAGSTADPMVWLTNDRRGCFNLPEIECAYLPAFSIGTYVRKGQREALLRHIASSPRAAWPNATPFTFKNYHRVYGSPQLDAVLAGSDSGLQALLQELEQAF